MTIETIELNDTNSLDDAMFIALLEAVSTLHNEEKAKEYALANWANLSEKSRGFYDYVYGHESRLKGWMTRDISESKYIQRKIEQMEGESI